MKQLTKFLYSALALGLLVSCSSETTKPDNTETKVYSSSTQKEFEAIEKGDIAPVPSYRRERPQRISPNVVQPAQPQKELPKEKIPAKIQNPELVANGQLNAKNQERLQEINQNLAFFCMKHRKDANFGSEEQCLKFTKKVLNECEKKHKLINTVMVNCIKTHLKKRR
jgi:hypothetical protein